MREKRPRPGPLFLFKPNRFAAEIAETIPLLFHDPPRFSLNTTKKMG